MGNGEQLSSWWDLVITLLLRTEIGGPKANCPNQSEPGGLCVVVEQTEVIMMNWVERANERVCLAGYMFPDF